MLERLNTRELLINSGNIEFFCVPSIPVQQPISEHLVTFETAFLSSIMFVSLYNRIARCMFSTINVPPVDRVRGMLSMGYDDFVGAIGGSGRAKNAWHIVRQGLDPLTTTSSSSSGDPTYLSDKAKIALTTLQHGTPVIPGEIKLDSVSPCGTRKMLMSLVDGQSVEVVLIPRENRTTICVSSQVGKQCVFSCYASLSL